MATLAQIRSSQTGTHLSPPVLAGFARDLALQQAGNTLLTCFSVSERAEGSRQPCSGSVSYPGPCACRVVSAPR